MTTKTAKNTAKTIKEKNDIQRQKMHDAFVDFINNEINNEHNIFGSRIDGATFEAFKPINGYTGKAYSPANHALLFCIGLSRKDPRFATFKQIKNNGQVLIKGCHGNDAIMHFPMIRIEDDDGYYTVRPAKNKKEMENVAYWMVKGFNVFNFADIDGMTAYEPAKDLKAMPRINAIEKMFAKYCKETKCKLAFDVNVSEYYGFYKPLTHEIHLCPIEGYKTSEDYYSVLLHELAHSTGKALERKNVNLKNSKGYNREELVAEISSFMLCQKFGISYDPKFIGNTFEYLKGYASKNIARRRAEIDYAVTEAEKVIKYLATFEDEKNNDVNIDNVQSGVIEAVKEKSCNEKRATKKEYLKAVENLINDPRVDKVINEKFKEIEAKKKAEKKDVLLEGKSGDLFGDFEEKPVKKVVKKATKAKKESVAAASALGHLAEKAMKKTTKKTAEKKDPELAKLVAGLNSEQIKALKAILAAS